MSALVYNIDDLNTGTVEPLVANTCHGQPVLQNVKSFQVKSLYLEPLDSCKRPPPKRLCPLDK